MEDRYSRRIFSSQSDSPRSRRPLWASILAALLALLGIGATQQWKGKFEFISPDGLQIRFEAEAMGKAKPP